MAKVELSETGALRDAIGVSQQALLLARDLEPAHLEGITLSALGLAWSIMGDEKLSHIALERALHLFEHSHYIYGMGVVSAYLGQQWLWLGDFAEARAYADRAWEVAADQKAAVQVHLIRAALLQGHAALGVGDIEVADERLHHALTRARAVNVVEFELPALIAIANLTRQRGDLAGAKARLDEVWNAAERGGYPLYQADAYNLLADIAWAESDKKTAIEAATEAYRAAWCDGPPWAYHWGLEKAKAFLREFGAPEPDMPPFDESKFEPMPEVEINPKDDYWIDPATLD